MRKGQTAKLSDVFGISRDVPLNYVARTKVDDVLVDSLTRDKHIVIFGSSKQGKTCLRKYNLSEDDHIVVTCSNRGDLGQLHSQILKDAGYTIELSTTQTVGGNRKISASFSAKAKAPLIGEVDASVGSDAGKDAATASTFQPLELDPFDPNDIIRALREIKFKGFVVLEDFHYLPDETQIDFSVALKAFHENSYYSFVVVGVWLDPNRLIQHNGDLTGRVLAVNVDKWTDAELDEVISKGEDLLNIRFESALRRGLIEGCFESVSILQEACHEACARSGVYETVAETAEVGKDQSAQDLIREVVDAQSARYNSFISNFADGFMATELEMYRWLLYPVLTADTPSLEEGLTYNQITNVLREVHPKGSDLNPGNITQALKSTASLQVGKLGIKPIILDYDQSRRRLGVVDRGFLIWHQHQDRAQLLSSISLPTGGLDATSPRLL